MKTGNVNSNKAPAKPFWSSPAMLVVSVVVAGLLLFMVMRPPAYEPLVKGKPMAEIDQYLFDYGDVPVGQMVNTEFRVKNIGDETLLIYDTPYVEVVEGCCPPQTTISSKRLEPGQEATVSMNFTMHPGMAGKHDFRVHVVTNDPDHEHQEVTVLSNWLE